MTVEVAYHKDSTHQQKLECMTYRSMNVWTRWSLVFMMGFALLGILAWEGNARFDTTLISIQATELVSPNEQASGEFGLAVSWVPDVNGDGSDDILVGAPNEEVGSGPTDAGRAYLFDGVTGSLLRTFVSPDERTSGYFGISVAGMPDITGDGKGEVIIGAYGDGVGSGITNPGRVYVFNGATGALIYTLVSPHEDNYGYFGFSVSSVADINGDGYADIVIGAYRENLPSNPTDSGAVYVFSGADGSLLRTLTSPNKETSGWFGRSVSGIPDVNGDGRGDILVGAHQEDPGSSPANCGRAYIFCGATGALLHTLVSPNEQLSGWFGFSVAGIADVDGDGLGDVVIGAPREKTGASPSEAGRAYVFNGATGALIRTLISPNEEDTGWFGYTVSGAPDATCDGLSEIIIGAYREDPGASPSDSGRAYIFNGGTGNLLRTLISPNEQTNGYFGFSVSGVRRISGKSHVVVGARRESVGSGPDQAGRAYIFPVQEGEYQGAPQPPTGVSAQDGVFCDRIVITWNFSSCATAYSVWRNTIDEATTATRLGIVSAAVNTMTDSNVTAGTTYYYWVKAGNQYGASGFSVGNTGWARRRPHAPSGVAATTDGFCDRVQITWSPVSCASAYSVWRSTTNDSATASNLGAVNTTTFNDTTVTPGILYYYWVRAGNSFGASEFTPSVSGSASLRPHAPTGTAATDGAFCDRVRITWSPVSCALAYSVWRSESSDVNTATNLGVVGSTAFNDFTVTSGTTYYYWVRAGNNFGAGPFSASDTGFASLRPHAPTGVSASDGTFCDRVRVTWNAVACASAYSVWRNTTNNSATATNLGAVNTTAFNDTTATPGEVYYYWVRAGNSFGASGFSATDTGFRCIAP